MATRASIYLDEELLEAARELGLNVSAVCRKALTQEVEARRNAELPEYDRVEAFQDGKPVSFRGKHIASMGGPFATDITDAYLTPKNALVFVQRLFDPSDHSTTQQISEVHTDVEAYFNTDRGYLTADEVEFERAISEAYGRTYYQHLDI